MNRLAMPLIAIAALVVCTGWGIMFTRGGQNPFPAATPTPSNGTTIDQCAANVGTGVDLPLTLTVATNTDGSAEGLLLIHKGTSSDPNQTCLSPNSSCAGGMDTFLNTWYNDQGQTNGSGVNKNSSGCLNADWLPVSNSVGSDTVTAKSPGTGLFNAAVLCTLKNFAAYDVSSGTPYPSPATQSQSNALTGAISPTISNELLAAMYYIDNGGPAATFTFSNLSSNSTITPGTPSDVSFTGSSVSSSATAGQLIGATCEGSGASCGATSVAAGNSVGFQRSFSPTGNFCGGIIAFTNAISSLTISPTNPSVNAGATQQFTATAVLSSGGTQNVLTGSPVWTSSNTSVATISNTGLATVSSSAAANSTTTITATYKGRTASTVLTVVAASAGAFPHLSNTGQVLTTYTPGSSVWLRSIFALNTGLYPLADVQAAGIDTWEDGSPYPYPCGVPAIPTGSQPANCGPPPPPWTCGTYPGPINVSCAHTWWLNNVWNPFVSQYQSTGMPVLMGGDNVLEYQFHGGFYTDVLPAVQDWTNSMFTLGSPLKLLITTVFHDEWPASNTTPCLVTNGNGITPFNMGFTGDPNDSSCTGGTFTPSFGMSSSITTRVATGPELQNAVVPSIQNLWYGTPTVGDVAFMEMGGESTPESGHARQVVEDQFLVSGISYRAATFPGSNPPPAIASAPTCEGPFYWKVANGSQFTPGTDVIAEAPTVPGNVVDEEMGALAHGYAGVRAYRADVDRASGRATQPTCSAANAQQCGSGGTCNCPGAVETGCSPLSAWTAPFNGFPELGQDRWYAMSAAYNVIKALEPYGLSVSPQMAPPSGAVNGGQFAGCNALFNNTLTNGSASTSSGSPIYTGSPIECGARQASGARAVVFINWSSNSNSISYDPTPYVFPSGTAASWKINSVVGLNYINSSCGTQTTNPAAQDCGIGPTVVTGATMVNPWGNGSVFPAAGTAPTSLTTLTMQPTEVDVFLYHP